jgi:hypothetical protein
MPQPKKYQPSHAHFFLDQKDAVIASMEELLRKTRANEIVVLSVTEQKTVSGLQKSFEVVYVEADGTRQ